MLGIFALNPQGIDGAIYQMLNHGVSTGGLFLLVGMLYVRRHTHEISEFGGLWKRVPIYAAIFMVVMLSSIGLPGLNGFVGEFLIMVGAFILMRLAVVIAVVGVILEALYMLWTYERVWFGPIVKAVNETISDLTGREIAVMVPVIALMLFMGLFPRPLISRIEPSVTAMLARANFAQAHLELKRQPNRIASLPIVTREPVIAAAAR
jgi:NADH-quinone oxidoreductase subunit M